ncbi:MAG TPA: hypothetical protein V6C97_22755 [Oculatellaceae cyanobacterium]
MIEKKALTHTHTRGKIIISNEFQNRLATHNKTERTEEEEKEQSKKKV